MIPDETGTSYVFIFLLDLTLTGYGVGLLMVIVALLNKLRHLLFGQILT